MPSKLTRAQLAKLLLTFFKFLFSQHQQTENSLVRDGHNQFKKGREDAFREVINFMTQKLKAAGIVDPNTLASIANSEE